MSNDGLISFEKHFLENPIPYYCVHKQVNALISFLEETAGDNIWILSMGAGNGACEFLLQRTGFKGKFVSVDIDFKQLLNARYNSVNSRLVSSDMLNLPFINDCFDVIVFFNSFHHIPKHDRDRLMNETIRVAKNGAGVLALEPFERFWRKPARCLFRKKWRVTHVPQERELDKEDWQYLNTHPNIKKIKFWGFSLFFQPLSYVRLPRGIQKGLLNLRAIDDYFARKKISWTYLFSFQIDK